MANPKDELLEFASQRVTPCQRRPELCKPRHIDAVFFDADGVIWTIEPHRIASSVRGPFTKIDDDTVEAGEEYGGYEYYAKPTKPSPPPKEKRRWWQPSLYPAELEPEDYGLEEEEGLGEIETELAGSLTDAQKKRLVERFPETTEKKEIKWDPQFQGWYERIGYGWYRMALKKSPPPPKDKKKEERRTVESSSPFWPKHDNPGKPEPKQDNPGHKTSKSRKVRVTLLPTFRQTLDELEARGISKSVISLNTPGSVSDLLKAFGLADRFVDIKDTWDEKGKVFRELTKTHSVAPCNTIFVDDTLGHVDSVTRECGLSLHMGMDIKKPIEIMDYIIPKGK